jgi:hypothetical protein
MLQSPRITGWRQTPYPHHSRRTRPSFLVRAQWPAIVSRRDVERATALLLDETLRPGSNSRWLLSKIATCGICGAPLSHTRATGRDSERYICLRGAWSVQQCGRISIDVAFLDRNVVDRLTHAVAGGLIQRISESKLDPHAPTVDEVQLTSLGRDYDDGLISRDEWQQCRMRITRRVRTDRAALADAPDHSTLSAMAGGASYRHHKTTRSAHAAGTWSLTR